MTDYRWNISETARDYDRLAPLIHPHYVELQDAMLDRLPFPEEGRFLVVDAGGGSGRLIERLLQRFPHAEATLVDQSEAFLTIARERLECFAGRVEFVVSRLQDDWPAALGRPADAVLSMSAIHHLDAAEKRRLYAVCHAALSPGGVLMNADEVRDETEAVYRSHLESWAERMREVAASEAISVAMRTTLEGWRKRNVDEFHEPKKSGDDCHETIAAQLRYLCEAGFTEVSAPWQKQLWALLFAVRRDG